jgi:hypothetical protein
MGMARAIIKEIGGRFQNAAGTINSDSNMFAGSSGNAPSDKLMGGANNNPVGNNEEGQESAETPATEEQSAEQTEKPQEEVFGADNTDTDTDIKPDSDERLKDGYSSYHVLESKPLAGRLRNLDLDPTSSKPVTTGGGGGNASGIMNMIKGFGGGGEGAGAEGATEGAGDMGADMGDAADAAGESDQRLKNIFGDDEDAIKAFAKIDAIKFVYNEKAHQIHPNGEHQVDYDPHYGVKAQDLAANPLTSSCVEKDESGYLCVNTPELTMANSAVISEICKRIEIIEKVLGIKVV